MIFKRAVQRYGRAPEPVTPYQRAAQVWDDRIGSARVQARNWRLMSFSALALAGALSTGLLWQSLQSRVVPYVVEVDELGEARAVAPLAPGYRPADAQVAWHLREFIARVRSVSLDPVLMRRNWLTAYDFVTERGARFLSAYAREADPFAKVGINSVSVQPVSVVRASDRTFQVKWSETAFERGEPAGTTRWTAMVTIVLKPPASAEILRKNPLGLYVDAIDWARELDEPVTPPRAPEASSTSGPATAPDVPGSDQNQERIIR